MATKEETAAAIAKGKKTEKKYTDADLKGMGNKGAVAIFVKLAGDLAKKNDWAGISGISDKVEAGAKKGEEDKAKAIVNGYNGIYTRLNPTSGAYWKESADAQDKMYNEAKGLIGDVKADKYSKGIQDFLNSFFALGGSGGGGRTRSKAILDDIF